MRRCRNGSGRGYQCKQPAVSGKAWCLKCRGSYKRSMARACAGKSVQDLVVDGKSRCSRGKEFSQCRRATDGYHKFCLYHREQQRALDRRRRQERAVKGICRDCGNKVVQSGMCNECYQRKLAWQRTPERRESNRLWQWRRRKGRHTSLKYGVKEE